MKQKIAMAISIKYCADKILTVMLLVLNGLPDKYTMNVVDDDTVAVVAVCLLGLGTVGAETDAGKCICPKWEIMDESDGWFKKEYGTTFNALYDTVRGNMRNDLIKALCSVAVGDLEDRDEFDMELKKCKTMKSRGEFRTQWYLTHRVGGSSGGGIDWGVTGEKLSKKIFGLSEN